MKLPFLVILILNTAASFCQSELDNVLTSAGGSSGAEGMTVSWTMGETIINEYSMSGFSLSQGFQKGLLSIVSESGDLPGTIIVTAYPNPVMSSLTIKIENYSDSDNPSITVYDGKGEAVIRQATDKDISEIDFSSFPPGAYLVKISKKGNSKIFNIIKQ